MLSTASRQVKSCISCKHFKEIVSSIDVFPYDKRKCTKFINPVFQQENPTKETCITYHTTFMARNSEELCGSVGKYFTTA
jgi:hypothetical protein